MKIVDLKTKTKEELKKMVTDVKKDIQNTTWDVLQKKEKNVKKAKYLRKDLARILTVLKEIK